MTELRRRILEHHQAAVMPCGERAAYVRHIRHGEDPCAPCRAANVEYARVKHLLRLAGRAG